MCNEIYSDGIGEITVSSSIVRVDLVSLSPTERDANNNPISVFRQRIVFSVEEFANSVEVMQKAFKGWWTLEQFGAACLIRPAVKCRSRLQPRTVRCRQASLHGVSCHQIPAEPRAGQFSQRSYKAISAHHRRG